MEKAGSNNVAALAEKSQTYGVGRNSANAIRIKAVLHNARPSWTFVTMPNNLSCTFFNCFMGGDYCFGDENYRSPIFRLDEVGR